MLNDASQSASVVILESHHYALLDLAINYLPYSIALVIIPSSFQFVRTPPSTELYDVKLRLKKVKQTRHCTRCILIKINSYLVRVHDSHRCYGQDPFVADHTLDKQFKCLFLTSDIVSNFDLLCYIFKSSICCFQIHTCGYT